MMNAEAAYRQTEAEHDALLHQYEEPGQTSFEQMLAISKGEDAEKASPKYWEDNYPREDINESSSWIDEIEYMPDLGIAIMKTNGREYYYPIDANTMGDWITSDSLGGFYNRNIKLKQ